MHIPHLIAPLALSLLLRSSPAAAEGRYDFDPDTQRNLLDDAQFAPEPERYPLSLLRQLRRTIRISAPVPDPVRSLISKLDRS